MSSLQRKLLVVGGCVVLGLAGCAPPAGAVRIIPVRPSPVAATAAPSLPSYPILLVDLPRQQMGQSVAPARSRLPAGSERDLDSPPGSFYASPYSSGLAPHTTTPLTTPPSVPFTRQGPIDTRYVP